MRTPAAERINLNKVVGYAIAINGVQIAAAVAVAGLGLLGGGQALSGWIEQSFLCVMALVVIWGAVLDIREAFSARRMGEKSDMLKEALGQLEELNGRMRAQQHDFMNHLQVVYGLIEMEEIQEAHAYLERIYGDIQSVRRTLKTVHPAINALLASKLAECDERSIEAELSITSNWQGLPVPGWEMCRVLGNLIDNAIDALEDTPSPRLVIEMGETVAGFFFRIKNNGPAIEPALREKIFQTGFTTKKTGHGMGLAIVQQIMKDYEGALTLRSDPQETCFEGFLRHASEGQPR